MELRRLGNSDIRISPVLMGTWQAGKAMWTGIDDNETQKAIRAAYDAGIKTVIIPESNMKDVMLEKKYEGKFIFITNLPQ